MAVLVSVHAYARLSQSEQQRVEDFLVEYFKTRSEIPYRVLRKRNSLEFLAAYRALAMSRLGYGTGIDAVQWNELLSPGWRYLPAMLAYAFRRFHPATDEAMAELKKIGIEVAYASTMGSQWLTEMKERYP